MPFGKAWNRLYQRGIKSACKAAGASCERVDEQIFVENILDRIYREIQRADLIVAELSDRNPNVYYETGYAHGIGKPVICLAKEVDDIPFDLRHRPFLLHGDADTATLKRTLAARVRAIIKQLAAPPQDLQALANQMTMRLRKTPNRLMSFARIRKEVDPSLSDDQLLRLIEAFPARFKRVRVKGKGSGLALNRPRTAAQRKGDKRRAVALRDRHRRIARFRRRSKTDPD